MDPNAVVLEISSDEDVDWKDCDGRGIADGGDDHDWLAELLDEVHKEDFSEDSDEVVVVSEVPPSEKPVKKSKLKSSLVDLDDDCVILDNDPDKPVEVRNDNPSNGEDDSDEIIVVSEKGQVACRDYPHPRHLCIKFPFSTTPNESHCDQCYCYVCDSLAPCLYWGNGSATMDHCCATDKDELWKQERKNAKNGIIINNNNNNNHIKSFHPLVSNLADVALRPSFAPAPAPVLVQPHVPIPRPGSVHLRHPSANFRPSNFNYQNRRPVFPSRSKLHPGLAQQFLLARSGGRDHHGYTQATLAATPFHRPVFKRTGNPTAVNRHPYASHRGNSGNPNRLQTQNYPYPNPVNSPVSYPPQSQTYSSPAVDQQWPPQSNPNYQSQVNSNSNSNSNNLFYQPHLVPSSSGQPSYPVPAHPPDYHVPSETLIDTPPISVSDYVHNLPDQVTQVIDNGLGLNWPTGQQVSGPINESTSGPGGLADYRYDWIFDNQPVEPGFVEGPGSYGLTQPDFSSDSSYIETGPIFDF